MDERRLRWTKWFGPAVALTPAVNRSLWLRTGLALAVVEVFDEADAAVAAGGGGVELGEGVEDLVDLVARHALRLQGHVEEGRQSRCLRLLPNGSPAGKGRLQVVFYLRTSPLLRLRVA